MESEVMNKLLILVLPQGFFLTCEIRAKANRLDEMIDGK